MYLSSKTPQCERYVSVTRRAKRAKACIVVMLN